MRTYKSFLKDFENLSNRYVKEIEKAKELADTVEIMAKQYNRQMEEVIEIQERLELMAKQYNEWKLEDNEGS